MQFVLTFFKVETGGFKALDPLQTIQTRSGAKAQTTRCPIRIDRQKLSCSKAAPALGADTASILGAQVAENV